MNVVASENMFMHLYFCTFKLPPNGKDYGVQTAGFPMIVAIGLLILCGIGAGFYRYKAAQKHKKMRKVRKATNVHYRAKPKDTHRDCV